MYDKNVCMFLMWAGAFLGGRKKKRGRRREELEIPMKSNLQAICTNSSKFHSRDFQVFGAHLYMGTTSQEMNLNSCSKMNQRPYLDAGYLHPYSL